MSLIGSGPEEDVMSTINITPFTDVLLVLLIIFMILTSLLKPPPVPLAFNKQKVTNSPLVIIINPKDEVQVGAEVIAKADLPQRMKDLFAQFQYSSNDDLIIKAAPTAKYGTVLTLMADAKAAGFNKFGLANKIIGAPDTNN
ncbi:MAG TPA: biopolymer transporter ExbD [Candidatus Eremiobacteraceae bacterium]|nr:biopolymer transporter ExbD [Candidatus Eremiobacteraceae bacterium]